MSKYKPFVVIAIVLALCGCQSGISAKEYIEIDQKKRVDLGGVILNVESIDTRKEVKPEKPSGYYHYYEKIEGYQYFVMMGTASNQTQSVLSSDDITLKGKRGNKTYEAVLMFSDSDQKDFIKTLGSNINQKFYCIILMKNDQSEPDSLEIYYNDGFKKAKEKDVYDHLIKWNLPGWK